MNATDNPEQLNPFDIPPKPLPCPFCGFEIDPEDEDYFDPCRDSPKWGSIICQCGATGPEIRTGYQSWKIWRRTAILLWNRRVQTANSPGLDF